MDYKELVFQVDALTAGVPHMIANLANASAAIWQAMENINWAGFYLMEGGKLVLGPFQGKPACIEIPVGKGVCGTAVAERKTQLVENVHEFPGHIACDCASNSEIVVPIWQNGEISACWTSIRLIIPGLPRKIRRGLRNWCGCWRRTCFRNN